MNTEFQKRIVKIIHVDSNNKPCGSTTVHIDTPEHEIKFQKIVETMRDKMIADKRPQSVIDAWVNSVTAH